MEAADTPPAPAAALTSPLPFRRRPSLVGFSGLAPADFIAVWGEAGYERDFLARRVLFRRLFLANSPEAARHVLLNNAQNYAKSVFAMRMVKAFLGQGLLTSEGELWRRQHRIMAPAFHSTRMRAFADVMIEETVGMLRRWEALGSRAEVEVISEMSRLTLGIILRTMFSEQISDEARLVCEAVSRYQRAKGRIRLADLIGLPEWVPRLDPHDAKTAVADLDHIIARIIARRRTSGTDGVAGRGDLLSMLLRACDERTGRNLDDQQLRDEVATIFAAGHETTANALTWTWYLLAQHPEAEERLHTELRSTICGRLPGFDDLANLPYARMVVQESLRLYPPAYLLLREALRRDEICGRRVPAASIIAISPWLLHRHRALWERPEAFRPERFAPQETDARPKFAYIPFGAGPRSCIGANFAMTETILVLAAVAQRFRLHLSPGQTVEPAALITLRPRDPLPMRLQRRG